ncbi:hypothetical protein CU100_15065 [Phyllobacterium endophyticum]|uniref:Uncharacterized protein n=1 Tax=Phyllobacterium endophyticum TaxID=1149773 RepID=A0A2P7AR23_9HYPH|nr:hypothetical protein CU100_15065 [Phyllobacterium endophyticum]
MISCCHSPTNDDTVDFLQIVAIGADSLARSDASPWARHPSVCDMAETVNGAKRYPSLEQTSSSSRRLYITLRRRLPGVDS